MYRRVPSFSSSCLLQAKDVLHADNVDAANTQNAEINLGYTTVSAPFNGVVTARKVSIGELVAVRPSKREGGKAGDLIAWPIPPPSTAIDRAALGNMRPIVIV
jgi:multidrug efflux pump subunit AcrA (membrane-fusion protein)